MEKKLLLEKVYRKVVENDIKSCRNSGDELFGLDKWVDFRLSVSGGSESSMGEIGMNSIKGFLVELEWWDNIMSDYNGCYRGDFKWEVRDWTFDCLDIEVENDEFRNEIKDEYNKYFNFEN